MRSWPVVIDYYRLETELLRRDKHIESLLSSNYMSYAVVENVRAVQERSNLARSLWKRIRELQDKLQEKETLMSVSLRATTLMELTIEKEEYLSEVVRLRESLGKAEEAARQKEAPRGARRDVPAPDEEADIIEILAEEPMQQLTGSASASPTREGRSRGIGHKLRKSPVRNKAKPGAWVEPPARPPTADRPLVRRPLGHCKRQAGQEIRHASSSLAPGAPSPPRPRRPPSATSPSRGERAGLRSRAGAGAATNGAVAGPKPPPVPPEGEGRAPAFRRRRRRREAETAAAAAAVPQEPLPCPPPAGVVEWPRSGEEVQEEPHQVHQASVVQDDAASRIQHVYRWAHQQQESLPPCDTRLTAYGSTGAIAVGDILRRS
jgi:hypothetical protein